MMFKARKDTCMKNILKFKLNLITTSAKDNKNDLWFLKGVSSCSCCLYCYFPMKRKKERKVSLLRNFTSLKVTMCLE